MKYKKVIFDIFLNLGSATISTFVLQLMILPAIANHMSDEQYGMLVTILALLNVIPATLGNVLNNIRLISDRGTPKSGNYNLLLIILSVFNIIIIACIDFFYEKNISLINLFLTLLASVIWLMQEYYVVTFRLQINYTEVLICNIILVLGYSIGYVLFLIHGYWQHIYILGKLLSLIYILRKSPLKKEGIRRDKNFNYLAKETGLLSISNILTRITIYADKLLIFPILGGTTVAIYYAATLLGKVVSIVIIPISSVMLTYLSRLDTKNDFLFKNTLICSSIICFIGYIFCLVITKPILSFLYPRFVKDAMQFIPITTITMVITSLITIINPFVLKFFEMKWQIVINAVYVLIYVLCSMVLLHYWGLFGFCLGSLVATCCKLITLLFIYYFVSTEKNVFNTKT